MEIENARAGGVPPPEMPRGAFAFFEEADGKPRLVLLDKENERWRGEDRYARVADAMFAIPYADKDQTPIIHLVRHPAGKSSSREYYSIYKPNSKRVYLVEGSISSVAAVLKLSTVRGRGSVNVNVQLGEASPSLPPKFQQPKCAWSDLASRPSLGIA